MKSTKRGKIKAIIAIWLTYMLVAGVVLFAMATRVSSQNREGEMRNRAAVVANQVPSLLENSLYTQYASDKMYTSKLNALTFALEGVESIGDAKEFLEEYMQSAGINGLAVFDRDGALLYASSGLEALDPDQDVRDGMIDLSIFERIRTQPDIMRQYYFDSANYTWPEQRAEDADDDIAADDGQSAGESHDLVYLEANRGRWLLFIDLASSNQQEALAYFDWREALQRIKTGDESILLAIDAVDGTLMSSPDSAAWGRPVETLELKIGSANRPASLDDLKDAFKKPNAVVRIGMDGNITARFA